MRTILIQNFHPANTRALVRDFRALDYQVVMPDSNWAGRINYYFPNDDIGAPLISFDEFMKLENLDILIGCYEQQNDFKHLRNLHPTLPRLILHTAGNNVPYEHGLSDYLLSPDIQTYNNYPAAHKMLYFFTPYVFLDIKKDMRASFDGGLLCDFIHSYAKYWVNGWARVNEFEQKSGRHIYHYGYEGRDGQLTLRESQLKMSQCFYQMYFKDRDCYGNAILEGMWYGTPCIALREFIHDKTLGMFFLNDDNAILGDSVDECISKLNSITFDSYVAMSQNAMRTVKTLTDNDTRLGKMREILQLN